jgi:hypothetical protein
MTQPTETRASFSDSGMLRAVLLAHGVLVPAESVKARPPVVLLRDGGESWPVLRLLGNDAESTAHAQAVAEGPTFGRWAR